MDECRKKKHATDTLGALLFASTLCSMLLNSSFDISCKIFEEVSVESLDHSQFLNLYFIIR